MRAFFKVHILVVLLLTSVVGTLFYSFFMFQESRKIDYSLIHVSRLTNTYYNLRLSVKRYFLSPSPANKQSIEVELTKLSSGILIESSSLVLDFYASSLWFRLKSSLESFSSMVKTHVLSSSKDSSSSYLSYLSLELHTHNTIQFLFDSFHSYQDKLVNSFYIYLQFFYAWVFSFSLLLVFFLDRILLYLFTGSLSPVVKVVKEIGDHNLDVKIPSDVGGEVGDLLRSIDSMRNDLLLYEDRSLRLESLLCEVVKPIPFQDMLKVALSSILSFPLLSIQKRGAIFLVDNATNSLTLTESVGLTDYTLMKCAKVNFGECLCGEAMKTRKIVVSPKCIAIHEGDFSDPQPHGHFIVPIEFNDTLLGVLNLYLGEGFVYSSKEESFLKEVASVLALVIERRYSEEKVNHLAYHDKLTSLPNRLLFLENLERGLSKSKLDNLKLALLVLDLDGFKSVNDLYGHFVGDLLLMQVADRLKTCIRSSDSVSRIGGDEFAIVLSDIQDEVDASLVAEKIVICLSHPFLIESTKCSVAASVGISLYPDHGTSYNDLFVKADKAMYHIKNNGKGSHKVYSNDC